MVLKNIVVSNILGLGGGRRLDLVAMGRDWHSRDRRLGSQQQILDEHFSHHNVVKNCNICLKEPKIKEKDVI